MEIRSFVVVEFIQEEGAMAVVPESWILDDSCFWPPLSDVQIKKAAQQYVSPLTSWLKHQVKKWGKRGT